MFDYYDWELLKKLISQSKGEMTFNEFSKECNVDAGYFSKIMNQKIITPPSPTILRKIASKTQDKTVDYLKLMGACGYLSSVEMNNLVIICDDEVLNWAIVPENRAYIECIYNWSKNGITVEMLKKCNLTYEISCNYNF